MTQSANLIGKRVREARLQHKPRLTQLALAMTLQGNGINLDQTQLSKIESGIRPVSDFEVASLAKALNVSSSWLLGETDDPKRSNFS